MSSNPQHHQQGEQEGAPSSSAARRDSPAGDEGRRSSGSSALGPTQVLPGLWLGSAADEAQPLAALRERGITHVLQVSALCT